jgi:hypothetical protein
LAGAAGDDGELSDDLEFHIQNAGKRMEMFYSQQKADKTEMTSS